MSQRLMRLFGKKRTYDLSRVILPATFFSTTRINCCFIYEANCNEYNHIFPDKRQRDKFQSSIQPSLRTKIPRPQSNHLISLLIRVFKSLTRKIINYDLVIDTWWQTREREEGKKVKAQPIILINKPRRPRRQKALMSLCFSSKPRSLLVMASLVIKLLLLRLIFRALNHWPFIDWKRSWFQVCSFSLARARSLIMVRCNDAHIHCWIPPHLCKLWVGGSVASLGSLLWKMSWGTDG